MTSTTKIDVVKLIDESPVGKFQWWIFILCGICMVLDGFDVQAMGYVAPVLLQEWHVDKASLGPVFGAGLFGLLIGSLAIWAVSFLNMIALYFLSNWLPTIAKLSGLSLEKAVLVGATLQLGAPSAPSRWVC